MKNTGGLVNSMQGTFDTSTGDFRLEQIYVNKKYFLSFVKIERLQKNLIDNLNHRFDNVEQNEVFKLSAAN